jgi:hypothetical protein
MRACAGIFRGGRSAYRAVVAHQTAYMPNLRPKTASAPAPPKDPMALVRSRADGLYRAAIECCRQHDRAARLHQDSAEPELEHKHVDALCAMCDGSLAEMSSAYEASARDIHPDGDEAWWHKANALWHTSREYGRRHAGCDAIAKSRSAKHSPEQLRAMQMEYELEASALLALRHAAEAYRKTRPELT